MIERGDAIRRFLAAARLDMGIAVRHFVLDVLAGSALVPRPARQAIYRLAGLDVETMNVFSGVRITGTNLRLGSDTFVNHDCYFDVGRGRIDIGERCHVAPGVMVLTAAHDFESGATSRQESYATTTIEDGVWIGARTVVLPGVRVGEGCVIAAGAVVAADCAPFGMYGGVPARRLRDLREVAPHAVATDVSA